MTQTADKAPGFRVDTQLVHAHGLAAIITLLIAMVFGIVVSLQFIFPDIDTQMYMKIGDAELLELAEGTVEAEMTVTMDSTVFLKIMDKSESPMAAYQAGKLKTKGEVPDLLKLQKLML